MVGYQWIEILHFWIWNKHKYRNLQVFPTVYPAQSHILSPYCKVDNFQDIYINRLTEQTYYQKAHNTMDGYWFYSHWQFLIPRIYIGNMRI